MNNMNASNYTSKFGKAYIVREKLYGLLDALYEEHKFNDCEQDTYFNIGYNQAIRELKKLIDEKEDEMCIEGYNAFADFIYARHEAIKGGKIL